MNQTKLDILMTLTELMYYCPHTFRTIVYESLGDIKEFYCSDKHTLKCLRKLLQEWKKYPTKK